MSSNIERGEKRLSRFMTLLNFLRCEQTNDEMIKIKTVIEEQLRLQPSKQQREDDGKLSFKYNFRFSL